MKYDTKTVLHCTKEIMKLPVDKKNKTIKLIDVYKLIETLIKPLPKKEAWKCLEEMKAKARTIV